LYHDKINIDAKICKLKTSILFLERRVFHKTVSPFNVLVSLEKPINVNKTNIMDGLPG